MLLPADEALKERLPAVGEHDVTQQRVGHAGVVCRLLYDSGQLLVVANEYKAVDGTVTDNTHQPRLQNLRGLIDNAQREVSDGKEIRTRQKHGSRGHQHRHLAQSLPDVGQCSALCQGRIQQMTAEA